MVFMVLEILDAQSGSTTGTSLVTTADVHPVPELYLEVKLEQEEGEEGGGDDDVEGSAGGVSSFSPPPPLPTQN